MSRVRSGGATNFEMDERTYAVLPPGLPDAKASILTRVHPDDEVVRRLKLSWPERIAILQRPTLIATLEPTHALL